MIYMVDMGLFLLDELFEYISGWLMMMVIGVLV